MSLASWWWMRGLLRQKHPQYGWLLGSWKEIRLMLGMEKKPTRIFAVGFVLMAFGWTIVAIGGALQTRVGH